MVRIVVGPQKVVHQAKLPGDQHAGQILLEGGKALPLEVLAGQQLKLWPHPHVVLPVGLIHGFEQEGDPADARLNGARSAGSDAVPPTPEAQRLAMGSAVGSKEWMA